RDRQGSQSADGYGQNTFISREGAATQASWRGGGNRIIMYDSDDALDRALLALPFEEPPSDLRGSLLPSTAYGPAPPFSAWEAAGLGAVAAVTLWLVIL